MVANLCEAILPTTSALFTQRHRNFAFRIRAPASAMTSGKDAPRTPLLSKRILETDEPIMVQMTKLLSATTNTDVLSLGQGIVYWPPPDRALHAARESVVDPSCHGYGVDDGTAELRAALVSKIGTENNLHASDVMVTAGANQAFVNVVLVLCDPSDSVVLFTPFYFNHQMAFQMTGVNKIVYGSCDPITMRPSIGGWLGSEWVEETLSGRSGYPIPKVITVCNPCNPTGVVIPKEDLRIAYPKGAEGLGASLLKAQDTIPICANLVAQRAALAALQEGPSWVQQRVKTLLANRELAREALACLGEDAIKGGEGGIYLWARLPDRIHDDRAVVKWLIDRHGLAVIPGSASGGKGHIRVAFGNLGEDKYRKAASRLKSGLEELLNFNASEVEEFKKGL